MRLWKAGVIGLGVLLVGASAAFAAYRQSVDEPAYQVLSEDGDFQLRQYDTLVVAEVTHTGDRRRALSAGFRRLADYIFAKDRPGEEIAMTRPVIQEQGAKIAMTAPVMQDGGNGSEGWRTRFVMPAQYTLDTLPTPPEDITLTEIPGRKIAAVRFSGSGSTGDLVQREGDLRQWMAQQGLTASGPAEYAFYDAPMVPPGLRRNEVMIPVE